MQLSKYIKRCMLALLSLTIAACGFQKSDHQIQSEMKSNIGKENTRNEAYDNQNLFETKELQQENTFYFGLNKYKVTAELANNLEKHATFLCMNPSHKVLIEGHTDVRGTPEYNIALGERRANAIKMYLQSTGVLANQISIVSYGKEKPASIGYDEAAYAKNRRAVLVY